MVTIPELWLCILLAAAIVSIASAIIWMVLPHHKSDFKGLPDEEAARAMLKTQALQPGQYNIPHLPSWDAMKEPEHRRKFDEGPVGFLTVLPNRPPPMGKAMFLSFMFFAVVSITVAYVTGRTLTVEAEYVAVFRVAGTVAFLAYGLGSIPYSIWFGRPWSAVIKDLFDSLVYGLLTAGAFAGFWPE